MPSPTVTLDEVKKNIRALLISAPRGLSIEDIEHDYRAMLGKPFPFKNFKCNNSLEFLKTMPDVVSPVWNNGTLILRGIADSSTRHIAKLVSRQKTSNTKSRRISKPQICTKPLMVPSHFRTNMKELLASYPHGVLGSALNSAYSRNYGEGINFAKLGFKSMSHLLGCIQDIALIVKDNRGGFRVCAAKRNLSKDLKPPVRNNAKPLPCSNGTQSVGKSQIIPRGRGTALAALEGDNVVTNNEKNMESCVKNLLDSKSGVSDELKEELIAVLTKRPNGVWAARLPFEYQALYNRPLSVISLGFYSVIELASSLPDVITVKRPFPNGDWMLFLAEKSKKDKNITKIHVSDEAIGKGVCFPPQTLPDAETIGVYVTHIKSPDCFWVQLAEYGADIKDLEEKMDKYYNSKESAMFLMDDGLIKLGQVCVAKFPENDMWYRGLVSGTPMQHLAEVFYVDYGNSCQVFKSDLRLMKKSFFELPPRAIKSRLANIRPKKKAKWDPASAHRLNELTADKELFCWVTDGKDEVLSLCICDTTSDVDIHINDTLVDEGFAVYKCKTPNDDKTLQPTNQQVVNNCSSQSGLPLPNGVQNAGSPPMSGLVYPINQALPDYTLAMNTFPNFLSCYGVVPICPNAQVNQPQSKPAQEENPAIIEEEKPSAEDFEFMRQVCEELADTNEDGVTVKRLDLADNQFVHLINYQGKPHVVSSEISALLWDADLLRKMLRREKLVILKEVIAREDNEGLFKELERLKIAEFDDEEKPKDYASLYELSAVPNILEAFKHTPGETITKLKEEAAAFEANPESFWTTNNDDGNDNDDSSQSDPDEASLDEMRLALQLLQLRRKRILRSMMKGEVVPGENAVDEVDNVERQMENIRNLIIKAEAKEQRDEAKEVEPVNKTENEQKNGTGDTKENKVITSCGDNSMVEVKPRTTTKTMAAPPSAPQEAVVKEQCQQDVAKNAKKSFEKLSISDNRQHSGTRRPQYKLSTVINPVRHNPQNFNHVTRPVQPIQPLLSIPPPPHLTTLPPTNFLFPTNNTPVAPIPGYIGDFAMPGVFPEMAIPPYNYTPCGPYNYTGLLNQAPVSPIMFPWNQNTFDPRLFFGARERQGR